MPRLYNASHDPNCQIDVFSEYRQPTDIIDLHRQFASLLAVSARWLRLVDPFQILTKYFAMLAPFFEYQQIYPNFQFTLLTLHADSSIIQTSKQNCNKNFSWDLYV